MSALVPALVALAVGSAPASTNLQHTSHPIPLLTDTPSNCIAIEAPRTHLQVILDKGELIKFESDALRHATPDQRRMALIRSQRASKLLADTSTQQDTLGCFVNSKLVAHPPQYVDWVYLVFYIFKQGHGRVWDAASGAFLGSYQYSTYGADCGWCPAGWESLRSLSGQPFLEAGLYVR